MTSKEADKLYRAADAAFKHAGHVVDGREVLSSIDNTDSISASLTDYEELRGIREVPLRLFETNLFKLFYSADDHRKTRALAERIAWSGQVSPLIVVVDHEGPKKPYVLEGAHRLGALGLLKAKSFPALVIVSYDA